MRKILVYTVISLFGWGILTSNVFALTVSPAKAEITVDPGGVYKGEIELFNEQNEVKNFFVTYENFEPKGDSGAPHFIGAEDGLATWIETVADVTLNTGERQVVPYTITIPEGTSPGGYFAAVFFGTQEPKGQGGGEVTVGGKIGVLLLLRVAGEVEEGGGLLDFSTKDNKRFFTMLPIDFEYRFNNEGGDRVAPVGEMKIKNTFRLNSGEIILNKSQGSVLPGSIRKFDARWSDEEIVQNSEIAQEEKLGFFSTVGKQIKDFHFGWYTAQASLTWGQTSQTASSSYGFFIIPWQLLSIVLFIILFFGFFAKIAIKKYNRFIIGQATNNTK